MFTSHKLPTIYQISARNIAHYQAPEINITLTDITASRALDVLRNLCTIISCCANYYHYHALNHKTVDNWRRWMSLCTDPQRLPRFIVMILLTLEAEIDYLLGPQCRGAFRFNRTLVYYVFRKNWLMIELPIHYQVNSSINQRVCILTHSLYHNAQERRHTFALHTIALLPHLPVLSLNDLRYFYIEQSEDELTS